MSHRDAASPIVSNRFVEESDEDFAATLDGLRLEMAPTTIQESVWVDMALLAIQRLRASALKETDDSPTDAKWLRFQSMAERSLNNAMNRLDKLRRAARRAAEAASASVPAPKPAAAPPRSATPPESATTTREPGSAMSVAPPSPRASDSPALSTLIQAIDPATRAEFLEVFRDDVAQMLVDGMTEIEVLRTLPELTLDDVRSIQADLGGPLDAGHPREPAMLSP